MAKYRVLIADEKDIDLIGIQKILSNLKTLEVVATTSNASDACNQYGKRKADLLIVSSGLPDMNIREIMNHVTQKDKDAKVIVLSDSTDITHLNQALKAGITGYLVKSITKKELQNAVRDAMDGKKVFSPAISKLMSKKYADLAHRQSSDVQSAEPITNREREVLQLIVDGYTTAEIAQLLFISPRTVDTHRANLLRKLDKKNTAGLVRYALEKGHVD